MATAMDEDLDLAVLAVAVSLLTVVVGVPAVVAFIALLRYVA